MFKIVRTKIAKRMGRWSVTRQVRRLLRQENGAAAVEFSFVALPFLALVFAIMETAIVFFAGQTLEAAVADSARLIMTGQAQTQSLTQSTFKTQVCSKIYGLFDCAGGVYVDVQTYTSFASVNVTSPVTSGTLQTSGFGYNPGGPGDIVVVRLYYQWPVYVSLLGLSLNDLSGNKRLLVATAAFRNEPYQ